jgi:hypothetical protein
MPEPVMDESKRASSRDEPAREFPVITVLVLVVLGLWLLFPVHRSARFPGSAIGLALGLAAALAFLTPLAYAVAKRLSRRPRIGSRLLQAHVHFSLGGAFVAVLHAGHRFDSPLGIALVAAMLTAVASGYAGAHLKRYIGETVATRKARLQGLQRDFDQMVRSVRTAPAASKSPRDRDGWAAWVGGTLRAAGLSTARAPAAEAFKLADAIATTELSIRKDEVLSRRMRHWLLVHVAASMGFYVLLVLHVVAAIQYGFRWSG